jgi:hypothetical protein
MATSVPTGPVGQAAPAPAARPDATDRWIVLLHPGEDVKAARARAKDLGVRVDRVFRHAIRGYAAKLTPAQLDVIRADPAVADVVRDGVVRLQAQSTPRGVRRVFGTASTIARIDGTDQRVNADVAIVDTGIDPGHEDLNVVGGVNCSTTNRDAWHDANGHGTHVAGTVGALDNGRGVVGVAPGVRLWAVRILDANGSGLVSWYVCGLDWIAAQRDPDDPDRPLFEAVNMSVAKSGSDDRNCGLTNGDAIHRAVCRVVASGVTVVAAAGNNSFNASRLIPASYNEVITVSALADTDGRQGGLGGNACYSWGTYDRDDTFADFSNYGSDIDLIAPGKCIWSTKPGDTYGYSSGTSMAAPHVTGAVALFKASRPAATPAEVRTALRAFGNLGWKVSSDPDSVHEPLLDVSRILALGDFRLTGTSPSALTGGAGGTVNIPLTVLRAENVDDRIDLSATAESGLSATTSPRSLTGLSATAATVAVTIPAGTPTGTHNVTVTGTRGTQSRSLALSVRVDSDRPTVAAPTLRVATGHRFDTTSFVARVRWAAATDATSTIVAYQVQWRADGGSWGATTDLGPDARTMTRSLRISRDYAVRVRARDTAGNWSAWASSGPYDVLVVQDTSSTLVRSGTWRTSTHDDWSGGTTRYARAARASIGRSFTGRGIAVVAPVSSSRGRAEVWIDGTLAATIDLHAAERKPRRVVFSQSWSASGSHSIRLVVLGTADRPRVDLDAFVIIR